MTSSETLQLKSDTAKMIIDTMMNISHLYDPSHAWETTSIRGNADRATLENEWDSLIQDSIIIRKDSEYVVNPNVVNEVRKATEDFLAKRDITASAFTHFAETQIKDKPSWLGQLVSVLGMTYTSGAYKSVTFSDYEWARDPGPFCEELVKANVMFVYSSSSKKHSYKTYHFRVWPFDAADALRNVILRHLHVEGLTDGEWQIITLLLTSPNLELEYTTVRNNINLTEVECRELITSLRERGLVEEAYGKVSLPKGLKEPLVEYFKANIRPRAKKERITHIKQRVEEGISNLWTLMLAKRLSELPVGETKASPISIKCLLKSEVREYESELRDIVDVGLAFDLGDKLAILSEIVRDLENWLRSCIKTSVYFIGPKDIFLARGILRNDIFAKCREYVKIQDPYLGEETFDVFEYVPKNAEVHFLTGISLREREDLERVVLQIQRLKSERRGKFQIAFVGNTYDEPPFHDRFILTRDYAWSIGTSLKQIGKGKETIITQLSKRDKEELIEPAFDRWWNAKEKDLQEKGLRRLTFESWKDYIKQTSDQNQHTHI